MDTASILLAVAAIIVALFAAYNLLHYILFLLVTHPRDAGKIGHRLNQFEQRQLAEWIPRADDCLKHDDENRTYDDVFGVYRDGQANYSTCVFPRAVFTYPYEAELDLLKPKDGMRLLELGCGSGAAAYYLASRRNIEIVCVTNSAVQADICQHCSEILHMHGTGKSLLANTALRRRLRCIRSLVDGNAELGGALENVKELSERQVEQSGHHGQRMNQGDGTVAIAVQRVHAKGEHQTCQCNRQQEQQWYQIVPELLSRNRARILQAPS